MPRQALGLHGTNLLGIKGAQGVGESTAVHLIARFRWCFTPCTRGTFTDTLRVMCSATPRQLKCTIIVQTKLGSGTPSPHATTRRMRAIFHSLLNYSSRPWAETSEQYQQVSSQSSQTSSSGYNTNCRLGSGTSSPAKQLLPRGAASTGLTSRAADYGNHACLRGKHRAQDQRSGQRGR